MNILLMLYGYHTKLAYLFPSVINCGVVMEEEVPCDSYMERESNHIADFKTMGYMHYQIRYF